MAALFSCNPPTPARNFSVHYNWVYNCVANPVPQAFEYGTSPDGQTLVKVGVLNVSSCNSTNQQFMAVNSRLKAPPPSGSIFYVRAIFPSSISNPDFYRLP